MRSNFYLLFTLISVTGTFFYHNTIRHDSFDDPTNMGANFSFPVPGSKGCSQEVTKNKMQILCPSNDSSYQGFNTSAYYDVGDATKATFLDGYTRIDRHFISCKSDKDGLYICGARLLTDRVVGDPDSFGPRVHFEWKRCQDFIQYGWQYGWMNIVC
jgi:hypothetical protein